MPTACSNRSLGICPAWKPHLAIAIARKQRVSGDQIQLAIVIEVGYSRKAARLLL